MIDGWLLVCVVAAVAYSAFPAVLAWAEIRYDNVLKYFGILRGVMVPFVVIGILQLEWFGVLKPVNGGEES